MTVWISNRQLNIPGPKLLTHQYKTNIRPTRPSFTEYDHISVTPFLRDDIDQWFFENDILYLVWWNFESKVQILDLEIRIGVPNEEIEILFCLTWKGIL
jgi:hypothetical protein